MTFSTHHPRKRMISIAQSQSYIFITFGQHDNVLRQMAKIPETERRYREYYDDIPSEADTHEVQLRDGDIVIVYVRYSFLHHYVCYLTDLDGWSSG